MVKSKKTIMKRSRALDYGEIRKRNNEAIRKTRKKKKAQHESTLTQINSLKAENEGLELRIQNLRGQLDSLKEIYYEKHAKPAEHPVIKTEPLDNDETGEDEIDEDKYDQLRQIINEINILNNS